jgi:hypothetical protein
MADEEVATKAPESDAQEDAGKNPTIDDPVARAGPTMGVELPRNHIRPSRANKFRNIAPQIDLLVWLMNSHSRSALQLTKISNWRSPNWRRSAQR